MDLRSCPRCMHSAGYRAYEYVESPAFCGLCHVNKPEYISHAFLTIGEVGCAECHVDRVQSPLSGRNARAI